MSFTDNSSNETGFIIERSTTSTTEGFIAVGGVAPNVTTYLDQTTTAFTTYYYRVRASNSSNQYSSVFTITTALNYCTPTYSNSCNSIGVVIDDFILKQGSTTIINNLDSNCSPNNYGDFTNTTYNVTAGSTYTFTARAFTGGGSGTYFDQHLTIWLDYDQDGLFEFSERVYRSDSASMPRMNPTAAGTFTIPNNISGIIRMRVRSSFNSGSGSAVTNPCSNLTYGEAEDYKLNVSTVLPASITTGTVATTPVCAGQTISVSFTTTNLSSNSYVVQLSDANGNNFTNLSTTGTSSPLVATIPFGTATGSGYKVRVNSLSPSVIGSESSTFSINSPPSVPTVTTPVNYCQNQTASVLTASGTNLKWYTTASSGTGSSTPPTPSTSSVGTTSYWVSQTVSGCESNRSQINVVVAATPNTPTVTSPVNYLQGQTAIPLTATGSNLKWYTILSGGIGSSTAPIPTTAEVGTFNHYVSQTINDCESNRATIQVNVTTSSSVVACPTIKVYLEGNWNGTEMTTKLNQQGLLPGQSPVSPFGVATPSGQPYKSIPWNYMGNEIISSYDSDVVDWVLVSLKTNINDANTVVYRTAALLRKTGTVTLQTACPLLNPSQSYYVVVEHRNHVGAASHMPIEIVNNKITYDFTQQQSYIPSNNPASGQQKVGAVYCLFAGDCNKASFSEINANDASIWRIDNGKFARYQLTDYNLDGEINANDDTIWRRNNGKFSGVNF